MLYDGLVFPVFQCFVLLMVGSAFLHCGKLFRAPGNASKVNKRGRVGEVDVYDFPAFFAKRIEIFLNLVGFEILKEASSFEVCCV